LLALLDRRVQRVHVAACFTWCGADFCDPKVMRKADLQHFLFAAGFDPVIFLPQPEPWFPFQVVATRPG
jgi:hypothetical protein